jgi:hypothetical protein
MWLASVMQMRKLRCAEPGSNVGSPPERPRSSASASRAGPMSASARGVGCIPADVRTKRGHAKGGAAGEPDAGGRLTEIEPVGRARHALGAVDLVEQHEHPGVAGHRGEFGFHI